MHAKDTIRQTRAAGARGRRRQTASDSTSSSPVRAPPARPRSRSISHHSVRALLLTTSCASPCFNLLGVPRPCVQRKSSACGAETPADRSAARADEAHLARGAHQKARPARGARTRRGAVRVCPVPGGISRSLFCLPPIGPAGERAIRPSVAQLVVPPATNTRHGTALHWCFRPYYDLLVRRRYVRRPPSLHLPLHSGRALFILTTPCLLAVLNFVCLPCSCVQRSACGNQQIGRRLARTLSSRRPSERTAGEQRGARCVCACPGPGGISRWLFGLPIARGASDPAIGRGLLLCDQQRTALGTAQLQ
jgi:hypothetical protein